MSDLFCPFCGSKDVMVARNMIADRKCGHCFKTWLPFDDIANELVRYKLAYSVLKKAVDSVKFRALDDRTPKRFIQALQDWRHDTCEVTFEASKKAAEIIRGDKDVE